MGSVFVLELTREKTIFKQKSIGYRYVAFLPAPAMITGNIIGTNIDTCRASTNTGFSKIFSV